MSVVLPPLRTFRLIALLASVTMIVALSSQRVVAQDAGDATAGRNLAHAWCNSCHVVDPAQRQGTSNGAPTFTAIAAMKTTTFAGLEVFLQTPHNRMPDLHLNRDEIDDVAAYILTLKP